MTTKEILQRIGYFRNQRHVSARELSQKIGMSPQYVAKIEGGNLTLTVEKLLKILDALAISPQKFFAADIESFDTTQELCNLFNSLSLEKKRSLAEFLKD